MTNKTVLLRKLTALSTAAPMLGNGKRPVSNGTWPDPLLATLAEIDDTVLKRKLTFSNGSSQISVVATGRRLLALVDATDELVTNKDILEQPLSNTETDVVTAVGEVLAAFAGQGGRIIVKTESADSFGGSTDVGVPISLLAEIMEVDLDEEQGDPLQMFIEAAEEAMTSCLFFAEGEEVGETGDDAKIDLVRNVLKSEWEAFRDQLTYRNQGGPNTSLICLNGVLEGSETMYVAEAGKMLAAFTAADEDAPAIHESWGNFFVI